MTTGRLVLSLHILVLVFVFHCKDVEHGVWAQNSIKPRKSKISGNYRDSESLRLLKLWKQSHVCPEMLPNRDFSDCSKPCKSTQDCADDGQVCCETVYGSDCEAECKTPIFYPPKREKNSSENDIRCVNLETGATYKLGEIFTGRNKTCCKCTMDSEIRCVKQACAEVRMHQGCFYNNSYYQEGQVVRRKDRCNNCTCLNSSVICTSHICSQKERCFYKGMEFREGNGLYVNECKHCHCRKSHWVCREVFCTASLSARSFESSSTSLSVEFIITIFLMFLSCWMPG